MQRKTVRDKVVKSRKLNNIQVDVYLIISKYGPVTGAQVKKMYRENIKNHSQNSETIRNRITELKGLGLVKVDSKDICPITGNNVSYFDITGRVNPISAKGRSRFSQLNYENKILRKAIREVLHNGRSKKFADLIRDIKL